MRRLSVTVLAILAAISGPFLLVAEAGFSMNHNETFARDSSRPLVFVVDLLSVD